MKANYFSNSWKICCYGGFLFGREAIRRFVPNRVGTLLYTGARVSELINSISKPFDFELMDIS